jgi:hypothetical protein
MQAATAPIRDRGAAGRSSPGREARERRLIGLTGLTSFILIVTGALVSPPLWETPGTNASGAAVAASAYADRGRVLAGIFIYSLAMGLFLWFAAGLWGWLRQAEPSPRPLSAAFAFGAVALAVLIMTAFVPGGLLAYRAQPAVVAGPLADLTFGLLAVSGIPTAVCLGAYAELVLRYRLLPVWTAWLAALGAATHVLIAASFLSHGAVLSLEGSVIVLIPPTYFAWILATSLVLLPKRPMAVGERGRLERPN